MFIYLALILFCFLLAFFKLPKFVENGALILIGIFLCTGYMTGTDWQLYELFYNSAKFSEQAAENKEFGYFWLQGLIARTGVDFWFFHIVVKLLVFYTLVYFIRSFKVNVFLFLALFIPEVGLYLFVDCPFRNMIAFGFTLLAFKQLFDNKILLYFVFVTIATFFHLSAVIMVLIYFVYKINIKIYLVLIITIISYIAAFNIEFLIEKVYIPLADMSPIVKDRLKGYFLNTRYIAGEINRGTYVRLFILLILLLFKQNIISGDKKIQYIYNITILFILIYPFGVSMKILHRFSIYLIPFYVFSVIYLLQSFQIKTNKYILYSFFALWSLMQTYVLVIYDYRYVPYSNYLVHWVKKDLQDFEYRADFNKKYSPYKRPASKK